MSAETIPTTSPESKTGQATYCPEDNKLRLYVGRVPRDEYEALRAEGWTSTPKQACDFVATWTPERRDRCFQYADVIEDEDQTPEERAADRAERFAGYRENRLAEATGHADRFDAGPAVHGFQSVGRAMRAADRHDRIAGRAVDAWDKAEYWQRRTAGVISHALYKSAPHVRMGRIKELEADLRRHEASGREDAWTLHYRNRLAYERQMLQAAGGRAGESEIEVGGTWNGGTIAKVNKSSVTGRVVSVCVIMPAVTGWHYRVTNEPGTPFSLMQMDAERAAPESYGPPTEASRAKLAEFQAAKKAAAKARKALTPACPLVNPTDADAERLQSILNAAALADHCARHLKAYGRDYAAEFKPSTVCRITQAVYSEASRGAYARAETRGVHRGGELTPRQSNLWSSRAEAEAKRRGPALCEVRTTGSNGSDYGARRVIVLTDKPQKPLPDAVWSAAPVAAAAPELELVSA